MLYINSKTLEVLHREIYNDDPSQDWVMYPYEAHEPEMYPLPALDSCDIMYGEALAHLFNGVKSIQEICDDITTDLNRYTAAFPQYDYFSYKIIDFECFDSTSDTYSILQPFGVYRPTEQRVKDWYAEYSKNSEALKLETKKNLTIQVQSLESKLAAAKKELEDANT